MHDALGPLPMQTTRDADVAVNPVFVTSDPKLLDVMAGIGVEPALRDRPGVYGYAAAMDAWLTTFRDGVADLIAASR